MTIPNPTDWAEEQALALEVRKRTWVHLRHPEDHIPLFEVPEAVSKPIARPWIVVIFAIAAGLAVLARWLEGVGAAATVPNVPGTMTIPFALLLACIALLPFLAKHFWEKYYYVVSIALGSVVVLYYVGVLQAEANLAKSFSEYISFIILLGSLFVVSGGILFRVRHRATPVLNVCMLLMGAILANVFGTTGASVLMIRPFIKLNKGHMKAYHVIFFIFAVSNVGGALTPIGDPPLFLGYLKGVPFWWVLERCWPMWVLAIGIVLGIFLIVDAMDARKVSRGDPDPTDVGPAVSLWGASNLLWISLILAAVFLPSPWREMLMALAACGSLWTTPRRIHVENYFNYAPIKEVALLFVGIFATMTPALDYLYVNGQKAADQGLLNTPGQYYFSTGALSSVLDNAPTYLTYLEAQLGRTDPELLKRARAASTGMKPGAALDTAGLTPAQRDQFTNAMDALKQYHPQQLADGTLTNDQISMAFLLRDPRLSLYLIAISLGAVFFGACTYIGNGPNFMVKSIAEHGGVKCPSFFAYIAFYTLPVLLPTFIVVWALFLK